MSKRLQFFKNLSLSWQMNFAINTTIICVPFILFHMYPHTIYELFKHKHRNQRKRTFDAVDLDVSEKLMTPEQVVEYYQSIGFEESI